MKRKCFAGTACPVARAYDAIGDWWSLLIMTQVVMLGARRFCAIQESLGLAKNILTARLRKLVEQGLLDKVPASDGSAYHEYAATPRGRDLYKVLIALRQWGEANYFRCGEVESVLIDRKTGEPVPQLEVRAADGRVLGPDDLAVVRRDTADAG